MSSEDSFEKDKFSDLKQVDLRRFEQIENITYCSYRDLYRVREKKTKLEFAAKNKHMGTDVKSLKKFFREVEIISQFNSPFIVKLIGYSLKNFKKEPSPVIITEYVTNGSLNLLMEKERSSKHPIEWDNTKKLIVIYGIASAMAHIHSKGVIHRELNPLNIFLDEFLMPKIGNFEYCINESASDLTETKIEVKVLPQYVAPEIINEMKYGKPVDVYSFSILLYEILTGKKLYENKTRFNIFTKVVKNERPEFPDNFPESFKNLISKCWSENPDERPTFERILKLLKTNKKFVKDLKANQELFKNFLDSIGDSIIEEFVFEKVHIEYPEIKELSVDLDPLNLSLYEKKEFKGKGQFGKVYRIINKKTKESFASKINIKTIESCTQLEISNLSREINILSKIQWPSILKYIGYSPFNFSEKRKPTIITEFSKNGSLNDIIESQKCGLTPEKWTKTKELILIYGISAGMTYLHSMNIIHRDLKPANILFDEYLFPKIGDFGLSIMIDDIKNESESSDRIGTPVFMSPEIITDNKYSFSSDVYAFSILLYELLTLEIPYIHLSIMKLYNNVVNGIRPEFVSFVPDHYKQLIEKCWSNDPEERPTFGEIVDMLENDEEFITDEIDEKEFYDYIDYVKNNKIKDSFQEISIDFEELKKNQEKNHSLNISFLDLKQFKKGKLIKKLDFFKIYEVTNKENKQKCEAKISTITINKLSEKEIIHLQREINILSKIDHPSFLKFIGYSPIDFKQHPLPVIVTEMPSNRSLADLFIIENSKEHIKKWDDTKKLINIYGIASAMSYLHSNHIIHRNLCPSSIFLDEYLFPKIGNYGLLTKIHSEASMSFQTTIGIKGNYSYSSPELLENNQYSESSDVYAFALIVYEIMTLKKPFENIKNFNKLFIDIVNNANRPFLDDSLPDCYKQLIEICWSQNPDDRPTFDDIASFLKNNKEFITENVDEDEFEQYVLFLENSKIDFHSENRVVCFNDIIQNINRNKRLKKLKSIKKLEKKYTPKIKKVANDD